MKKIVILCLFLFCTSCATMETGRTGSPFYVDIPEKDASIIPDPVPAPVAEAVPPGLDTEARALNKRLHEIIQDSPLRAREDIFVRDPGDPERTQDLSFSFYDADLVEVIRVFMRLLEEDYIIHPEVSGRVSLFVEDDFNEEQLFDLLAGVLRVNNMAMIKPDNVWEFLPQSRVPRHIAQDRIIFPDSDQTPKRGQVIQGFRLNFIAASEMINILMPYLSQNAQVYAHESKGVLLVSDYPHSLEKVSDLVALFDESVFADVSAKVFPLKYIDAEEAAEQLEQIAERFGLDRSEIGPRARVTFLPLERLNMVLAVTRSKQVLDFVDAWVESLDTELPPSITGRSQEDIYVYYVQYGDAEEIVESMRGVFEDRTRNDDQGERRPRVAPEETPVNDETPARPGVDSVSGELSGPVVFNIDRTTNSIITRCKAIDYPKVLSVIRKLDLYPKQVLIEVIIVEVSLTDSTSMGVDWRYLLSLGSGLSGEIRFGNPDAPMPITGGVLRLESSRRLKATLQAALDESLLQILSTPTLLASDNKPATINIGDQIPFPTSSRRRLDDTDTSEVIDTTFQYRDTGIILQVTPKINKHGMVRMEITQEVSSLTPRRVEGIDAPVVNTRHAQTTLAVNDQQTIVIAGLMEQERTRGYSGVPGIGRVPGLRNLFGSSRTEISNTELLVFITPHVISSQEDSSFLTRNFMDRLDELKLDMR